MAKSHLCEQGYYSVLEFVLAASRERPSASKASQSLARATPYGTATYKFSPNRTGARRALGLYVYAMLYALVCRRRVPHVSCLDGNQVVHRRASQRREG